MDQAKAHLAPGDKGNRDAPGAQPADKGLGAIDRVDHPDALALAEGSGTGLLAEEAILWPRRGQPGLDQQLDLDIGLTDHILGTLVGHGQCFAVRKVTLGQRAGVAD